MKRRGKGGRGEGRVTVSSANHETAHVELSRALERFTEKKPLVLTHSRFENRRNKEEQRDTKRNKEKQRETKRNKEKQRETKREGGKVFAVLLLCVLRATFVHARARQWAVRAHG